MELCHNLSAEIRHIFMIKLLKTKTPFPLFAEVRKDIIIWIIKNRGKEK